MHYKVLIPLSLAATALAAPATDATGTSSSYETSDDYDVNISYDDSYGLANVPSSILAVLATAIPSSFYDDVLNPASRSAIISAAAAGTYPAWYNELPSSVKAWATSNFDNEFIGASATAASDSETAVSSASQTAAGSASETGSSAVAASNTASQTASSAVKTTSSSSSASTTSGSASSSDASSSSASASASPSHSTGGAPAPAGGVAMGVAGAAGILALALAL
ncbi:hypothetical protein PENARI_c001G08429 [Penicillium arizonense]|uniref:REJ domain-containing protein n=1 Tax=Penicillium arizonense TaxID=1835702 RepID=A0A1F5LYF0_PENAI|nr:hypothetical protein PENARI_c001G08429 [Penicillium arizonense]OGE58019.1 hypothetical protein PENARI_c001G08429 [Penicillium arizonense]